MFALEHKTTGEVQFVEDKNVHNLTQWNATELTKKPGAYDVFQNGTLTLNTARRDEMLAEAELAGLTHQERKRRASREARATFIDDMLAEGMINLAMATKLRARLG